MWEAINELKRLGYWLITGGRKHIKEHDDDEYKGAINSINHSISKGGTDLSDAAGILFRRNLNNKINNADSSTVLGWALGLIFVVLMIKG